MVFVSRQTKSTQDLLLRIESVNSYVIQYTLAATLKYSINFMVDGLVSFTMIWIIKMLTEGIDIKTYIQLH